MDDNYNVRRPGETLDQLYVDTQTKPGIPPKPKVIKNPAWRWWAFWRPRLIEIGNSPNDMA